MLNAIFHKNFPFGAKYFEEKLKKYFENQTSFPQSIILEGSDSFGSLFFALELARILNCEKNREETCTCRNCNWIKELKHPNIVLVSPINFKSSDKSATVISAEQCTQIAKMLEETSDYHRVFIFLDAKSGELSEIEKNKYNTYSHLNYEIEENWIPAPITHKIFQDRAANVILKSVEEPPKNTTFIFLTNNKENIISTIVSRSQVFKLPAKTSKTQDDFLEKLFKNYPNIKLEEALEISTNIQNYAKDNSISGQALIAMLIDYFSGILIANSNNKALVEIIKNDAKKLYLAEKMASASMQTKNILDWFLIELAR